MTIIKFDALPDLITPGDLIEAGYPGGKSSVYNLFNRQDFPKVRLGKKFLVSKEAFIKFFTRN